MGFQPEIEIPKNVSINVKWLEHNYDNVKKALGHFLLYPDLFLDMITPKNSSFKLFFYQRIMLRVMIRFRYIFIDAPRAGSKSFIAVIAGYLKCMFLPNTRYFLCAPGKGQSVQILQPKIKEIWNNWPFLKKELIKSNMGADYTTLVFKNGSVFEIVGALSSSRGQRFTSGIIEEVRDHDGTVLNEVVLPTLNVDRRTMLGQLDPTEPNQQLTFVTSAGTKGTYAYERLCELFVQSIVSPKSTFVMGFSYRLPQREGLLNKSYIEDLKLSSTLHADSFSREYLSVWTGGSSDAWLRYDKLSSYRKIFNPEKKKKNGGNPETFYYISVDVARVGVNTSIQVWKVYPTPTFFRKILVNIYTLHDLHFGLQSIEIKKLISLFDPRQVLIDGTGMGVGLVDFLVIDQVDENGVFYPGYASCNDNEYSKYKGEKILYILKATPKLNSQIHTNFYNQISNGNCRFLINEQEAKSKLNAMKMSLTMRPIDKLHRIAPHMETTKLFDEICNLKIKNVIGDTTVEQINRRIPKDRFSAAEYALWGIKPFEDAYYKKKRTSKIGLKNFIMFNKGGD